MMAKDRVLTCLLRFFVIGLTYHLLLVFDVYFKYGWKLKRLNQNHSLRWRSLCFSVSNAFDRFITIGPTLFCLRSIKRHISIIFSRAYSFLGKPIRYFFGLGSKSAHSTWIHSPWWDLGTYILVHIITIGKEVLTLANLWHGRGW